MNSRQGNRVEMPHPDRGRGGEGAPIFQIPHGHPCSICLLHSSAANHKLSWQPAAAICIPLAPCHSEFDFQRGLQRLGGGGGGVERQVHEAQRRAASPSAPSELRSWPVSFMVLYYVFISGSVLKRARSLNLNKQGAIPWCFGRASNSYVAENRKGEDFPHYHPGRGFTCYIAA